MNSYSKLELLGQGISRIAYRLKNGKVLKVPFDGGEYASFAEQEVYDMLPERFKKFFPNPKFIEEGIILCDYVTTADSILYQNGVDEISIECFVDEFTMSSVSEVNELFDYLGVLDVYLPEIFEMMDNFGINENKEFCIIDWGERG